MPSSFHLLETAIASGEIDPLVIVDQDMQMPTAAFDVLSQVWYANSCGMIPVVTLALPLTPSSSYPLHLLLPTSSTSTPVVIRISPQQSVHSASPPTHLP
jgi:hypothetical protein